jgi:hypothetical protein
LWVPGLVVHGETVAAEELAFNELREVPDPARDAQGVEVGDQRQVDAHKVRGARVGLHFRDERLQARIEGRRLIPEWYVPRIRDNLHLRVGHA